MSGVTRGQESRVAVVLVVKTEFEVANEATAAIPVTAHPAAPADLVRRPSRRARRPQRVANVSTANDQRNASHHESRCAQRVAAPRSRDDIHRLVRVDSEPLDKSAKAYRISVRARPIEKKVASPIATLKRKKQISPPPARVERTKTSKSRKKRDSSSGSGSSSGSESDSSYSSSTSDSKGKKKREKIVVERKPTSKGERTLILDSIFVN